MSKRSFSLVVSFLASMALLTALLLLLGGGQTQAAAAWASPRFALTGAGLSPQQTYTPVVTITLPTANAVLTTGHQPVYQVQVECDHGTNVVVGSARLEVVSVTVDGGLTYHEAVSGVVPGRYVYSWTLPAADYVTRVLMAQARNGWGNVGRSDPVTVRVDTVAPTATAPLDQGRWSPTSTLVFTWSPSFDQAGIAGYTVNVTGSDDFSHTAFVSSTRYTVTAAAGVTDGMTYYARLRAADRSGNRGQYGPSSDGVTTDLTAPEVVTPSILEDSDYIYPVGATLYYTNRMDLPQYFFVSGYSRDAGSGMDRVTFSPAFEESPADETVDFWPWVSGWPDSPYRIGHGATESGVITATAYDEVGHATIQVFPYAPDGAPPTSTVAAPAVWYGLVPIPITWRSGDTHSGVARTRLYYRQPGDTGWRDSGLEQPGSAGTFHFSPAGTLLASDYLTYYFASRATDNLGNASALPSQGVQVVIRPVHVYLPLLMRHYPPSWRQSSGTDDVVFYDVAVCPANPSLQYAGTTENGIYRSTDGGETWQHWALSGRATPVVVNPSKCAEAFVAVWGAGVYRVTGLDQATPINQGLGETYLYGLAISADGQTLYAGSNSRGVYKTGTGNIDWQPVNAGISDLRIRSLYMIGDTLYAGSRQCTYFYSDNGGASWQAEHILPGEQGGECGDAQVWAIAELEGVLYASLGLEKGLYRRSGPGNWSRVTAVPPVTIFRFGLRPHLSNLYVGTYGYGVYVCDSSGGCAPLPNPNLGTDHVRGLEVALISDRYCLLAGSDDGIWWVPLGP